MAVGEVKGTGTWRQVAAVIDGKRIPVGPGALLEVRDDGYTVTVNGRVYQRGTTKNDYQRMPHESEVTVTQGPQAGEVFSQIFLIEGDVLIACAAAPGAARPTSFTSPPGSGHVLSVWLRASGTGAGPIAHSWWSIVILVVLAGAVGGASQDLGASVGPWAGMLAGGLAGVLFVTAIGLLLRWDWPTALVMGITIAVAGNIFDGLRAAVAPTLGAVGAVVVSASTAFVVAAIVAAVLKWLLKRG